MSSRSGLDAPSSEATFARRGGLVLLMAVALGVCTFFCGRMLQQQRLAQNEPSFEDVAMLPELRWLQKRFRLDEVQFARVSQLHLAYRPRCRELCRRIRRAEVALMQDLNEPGKDFTAALQAKMAVQFECQQAMLAHMRSTAACMRPDQANEYLGTVLPHFLGTRNCCDAAASNCP